MRPIDADALIKKFENMGLGEHGLVERIFADGVYAVIENAPTIEAEPVRHGEWKKFKDEIYCSLCECTALTGTYGGIIKSTYCPHCGAKMTGGVENAI